MHEPLGFVGVEGVQDLRSSNGAERRNGEDLAAVVSLEHLELMREVLASQEAEKLAAELDFTRPMHTASPPAAWFEGDEPRPF